MQYNLERFKVNHQGSICFAQCWLLVLLRSNWFVCRPTGLRRQPELRSATGSRGEVGPDAH